MKRIIGLTGGIGAGKSTVSKILVSKGAFIIDADIIGREVLNSDARETVIKEFGEEFRGDDGFVDRAKLGAHVFADKAALDKLNSITHPLIKKRIEKLILENDGLIVIDCALLTETGIISYVTEVWLVTAPLDLRVHRVMLRNGLSEKEVLNRIASQSSDDEKRLYADHEIINDGSIESLAEQIDALLN